jgi:hypothetical protein
MRYADSLLIEGEQVALRTRQHWLALVISSRYGLMLWMLGVALLLVALWLRETIGVTGFDLIGRVVLGLFAIGLVIFVVHLWQWWAQDYMITNRRLMKVWGVLNKHSVDSALEKVNDARLRQSVFGRIFNYGHLDILTASEATELDDYDMIKDPKGFKRIMLTQKHALEMSFYSGAPSPPLRAPMDMNGETLPPPIVPPPAPGTMAAPAAPPMTEAPAPSEPVTPSEPATSAEPATPAEPETPVDGALEITQTLARLADLRDRGAISEEEFQAKKQELLDRL